MDFLRSGNKNYKTTPGGSHQGREEQVVGSYWPTRSYALIWVLYAKILRRAAQRGQGIWPTGRTLDASMLRWINGKFRGGTEATYGKYPNDSTSLCADRQNRKRTWSDGGCSECKHSSCEKPWPLRENTAVEISVWYLHDRQYDTVLCTEHYVSSGVQALYQLTHTHNLCSASGRRFATVSRIPNKGHTDVRVHLRKGQHHEFSQLSRVGEVCRHRIRPGHHQHLLPLTRRLEWPDLTGPHNLQTKLPGWFPVPAIPRQVFLPAGCVAGYKTADVALACTLWQPPRSPDLNHINF
jgi:hypothetical protein